MCSKSNTLKSKNCTCKCANACLVQRFEAKKVVLSRRNETKVVARVMPFRSAIQNHISKETEPKKYQMAHTN